MYYVNVPGLLSLCSSYISYSYFLRVPVIFANLRVNINQSKPNITGSCQKRNFVLHSIVKLVTVASHKRSLIASSKRTDMLVPS